MNIETDRFNCWSCGFKGWTLERLLRLERNNPDLEEYLDGVIRDEDEEENFVVPKLPDEFQTFAGIVQSFTNGRYVEYLKKRGIGINEIYRYKIGFCDSGKYAKRVVVPSFDQNGELNTFSARSIYDVEPKYDAPSVDKNKLIFNELMVDWKSPITIVEGVLDAVVGGDNCIPLCGKTLSKKSALFQKVVKGCDVVHVALDRDAFEEAIDICEDLMAYGLRPRLVLLDGKDPADMGRHAFRAALSKAIDIKDESQPLRARMKRMLMAT